MDNNIPQALYTIHYTDDKGEVFSIPVYILSLLDDIIRAIRTAPGHRIDRIVNHGV
jgi:hypothetical protein